VRVPQTGAASAREGVPNNIDATTMHATTARAASLSPIFTL